MREEREELARLRKEVRVLRMERGLLRQVPVVTFAAIDAEKTHYSIARL